MEIQEKKKEEKCTHEYRIKGWPKVAKLKTGWPKVFKLKTGEIPNM